MGIVPTRPGEPTHKAHVERSVGIAQDWINEYLRPTVFDCLDDLNDEIYQQVEWINKHKTPYRGFDGHTRFAEFEEYEKHALKALPDMAWEYREWKVCSVRPDCHFQIDRRRYSVPYTWVGSQVRVGLGDQSVAIYSLDGKEHIWTHPRNYGRPGSYVSEASHQAPETYVGGKLWTKDRYQTWAGRIGPATLKAVTIVLERVEIVSQGFYTCENIMGLTKRYSRVELEQACQYVLRSRQYVNYRNIHDALTMFADRTGITAHDEPTSKTTRQASLTPKAQPEDDTADIVFDNPHLRGINAFQLPQPSTPPTPQPGTTETGKKDK
ncbi:Mu transposase domain-containing protein [Corynebacterium cystitidis]|uniref:Mu transposase domain-containing protein n=1 Tax=Corynebacterium cystitidis TaxID=35757 RepID=UPI00211EB530|nr:hypothetical protein [Corynebacterium cystitidis]